MHDLSHRGPPSNAVAREVVLDGDAAIRWIADLGWSTEPRSPRLRLVADLIRTDTFAIGRIWHTPARLTFKEQPDQEGCMFHSFVGVEGVHRLTSGAGEVSLPPGGMYVSSFGERLEISADEAVARIFFVSRWADLPDRAGRTPDPHVGVFGERNAYRDIFTSAAHAALNSVTTVHGDGFDRVRDGLQHLFAGVLVDDAPARSKVVTRGAPASRADAHGGDHLTLLRRASRHLERNAKDITFDVSKLARELGVSAATLYRAYEESSMTPASQLRRIRARHARMLLESGGRQRSSNTQDLRQIAQESGFGSVRAMRRALDDTPLADSRQALPQPGPTT
ncbi:hypothetical protein [Pseudoclavibacter helvolus]|uniref:hypothetical protein n=1 Tax=Pseudoclavibacter helvolus TaxID=255205 RepID=UPI003C73216F